MSDIARKRRAALAARRHLAAAQRRRYSQRACGRLARLPAVRRARHIGLYWPLASEIDPRPLTTQLARHALVYFPRVCDDVLGFVAGFAHQPGRWRRSTLGVLEPRGPARSVSRLDVLIMPLAGFDRRGERIGLGGGFYDRTLAGVRARDYRSPTRIGLAFEAQRVGAITPQAWDVPLHAIVTEAAIYRHGRDQSVGEAREPA